MEDLLKDLKIILDDENMIGKTADIIEAFYRLIKYDIENIEHYEEKYYAIDGKMDFLKKLIEDIDNNDLNEMMVIKISYNPAGVFYYEGV